MHTEHSIGPLLCSSGQPPRRGTLLGGAAAAPCSMPPLVSHTSSRPELFAVLVSFYLVAATFPAVPLFSLCLNVSFLGLSRWTLALCYADATASFRRVLFFCSTRQGAFSRALKVYCLARPSSLPFRGAAQHTSFVSELKLSRWGGPESSNKVAKLPTLAKGALGVVNTLDKI